MTQGQSARLKKKFLGSFARTGNITESCDAVGIQRRSTVYDWKREDPDFLAEFEEAEAESVERLEAEVRRRGADGYDEPVFHQGAVCGTVRKYSDTLLIFLMKARNPEKFRDKPPVSIDANAQGGVQIYLPERQAPP